MVTLKVQCAFFALLMHLGTMTPRHAFDIIEVVIVLSGRRHLVLQSDDLVKLIQDNVAHNAHGQCK
jgi:hypothetical protein